MRGFNSTITKKQKICVSCGKPCFWFSKKRCQSCATVESVMEREEKATEKLIEQEDLSGLISDADAIWSQYIRLSGADKKGIAACFTCDTKKHWTMLQCGHFIKRAHLYLRWDSRNTKIQCSDCNEAKNGNIPEFTKRLEKQSPGITEILYEEMRLVYKPTRDEIRQIIQAYSPLVKSLKLKLKSV